MAAGFFCATRIDPKHGAAMKVISLELQGENKLTNLQQTIYY